MIKILEGGVVTLTHQPLEAI